MAAVSPDVLAALREQAPRVKAAPPHKETKAEKLALQEKRAELLRKAGGMTHFLNSSPTALLRPVAQMTATARFMRSPAADIAGVRRFALGASVLLPTRERRAPCTWARPRSRAPRARRRTATRCSARSPARSRRSSDDDPVGHLPREVVR